MLIYKDEKNAGLAAKILENKSIAYHCPIKLCKEKPKIEIKRLPTLQNVVASQNNDYQDLYYIDDVLVSTGWNLNQDIFMPNEVWAAKDTPTDKPMNMEHDCHEIVGHIIGQQCVNSYGEAIPNDSTSEEIPDKFHVVSSAVIYKYWRDADYMQKINNLIGEIQSGNWSVSMEAIFDDFDYGFLDSTTATYKVIPRTSNTAFLTKYLRQYGGIGEYLGSSIGRVLRKIIFSGKGLTKNPANPESIIFTENKKNDIVYNNSGYLSLCASLLKENTNMTLEELQAKYNQLEKDLQVERDGKTEAVALLQAAKANLDETATKVANLEKQVVELTEQKTSLASQLDEIKAAKVDVERLTVAKTDLGFKEEDAKKFVDTLKSLNDEQFKNAVASAKSLKTPNSATAVLEGATKTGDTTGTVANTETGKKLEETRKKIGEFLIKRRKGNKE